MTPAQEYTYHVFNNSSEKTLRGELSLWGYEPSEVINKDILINMLMNVYFG
jgi:hypothetical protein